ncbi:uncharacterized protein cubi_01243 [Cryptosporidium ubiquitum]|uniref:Uncharacterized protein n=1 Tax=Cryptosporidium ubiquitum TaxID=857276 RepID=A0A1J4M9L2_9CRYT|nr:uncharacterized protein cubi_01243 [Cryptosporidium ubiquitum]OII70902.1 hypothetical protein cubi_01243 [Cryptosporidium ubiquitum]
MLRLFGFQLVISSLLLFSLYNPRETLYHSGFDLTEVSFIKVKSPCCSALKRIRNRICCCCCCSSSSCNSDSEDEQSSGEDLPQEPNQPVILLKSEAFDPDNIPPKPSYPAPKPPMGTIEQSPPTFPEPPSPEELESMRSPTPDPKLLSSLPQLPPPPPPVLPKPNKSKVRRVLRGQKCN